MATRVYRSIAVSLLMATAMIGSCESFSTNSQLFARPSSTTTRQARPKHGTSSSTKLSMMHPADMASNLLLSTTTAFAPAIQLSPLFLSSSTSKAALMTDPAIEAEVLNDMSHIALDITTFLGPATAAIRLAAVVGRLLAMSADYVPDHHIMSEEFLFQVAMLGIASRGLIKSALPLWKSAFSTTSFRDGRTYQALFSGVGVSWLQYKTMMETMDWIEVEPNTVISSQEQHGDDEQHMYWLYSGNVQVQSQSKTIQNITRRAQSPRLDESNYMALLGGMDFVRKLDERRHKNKNHHKTKQHPKTTVVAGPSGATLLRINTAKLTTLMDNDEQLAQSIRSLLVSEMEEKLSAMLETVSSSSKRQDQVQAE